MTEGRYEPGRYAVPSSGDDEADQAAIVQHIKHTALLDEGMCPNDCGPLSRGEYDGSTCVKCGFWCNRLWRDSHEREIDGWELANQ